MYANFMHDELAMRNEWAGYAQRFFNALEMPSLRHGAYRALGARTYFVVAMELADKSKISTFYFWLQEQLFADIETKNDCDDLDTPYDSAGLDTPHDSAGLDTPHDSAVFIYTEQTCWVDVRPCLASLCSKLIRFKSSDVTCSALLT